MRWRYFLVTVGLLMLLGITHFFWSDDGTPPVLHNLIVSEKDFVYDSRFVSDYGPLLPFGATVSDHQGHKQISPTFEFYVRDDALIYSPLKGVVIRVEYQPEDDDYYLWLAPTKFSSWIVEIDHVISPKVKEKESVTPGQVLGTAGTWYPEYGVGRTELMIIKKETDGRYAYYCPVLFFAEEQKPLLLKQITEILKRSQQEHEIDLSSMPLPGCLVKILRDGGSHAREEFNVVE